MSSPLQREGGKSTRFKEAFVDVKCEWGAFAQGRVIAGKPWAIGSCHNSNLMTSHVSTYHSCVSACTVSTTKTSTWRFCQLWHSGFK